MVLRIQLFFLIWWSLNSRSQQKPPPIVVQPLRVIFFSFPPNFLFVFEGLKQNLQMLILNSQGLILHLDSLILDLQDQILVVKRPLLFVGLGLERHDDLVARPRHISLNLKKKMKLVFFFNCKDLWLLTEAEIKKEG